jgi:hypothetical protein
MSEACPECGVVPSRFVEGDHDGDCSLAPGCPACGCDPDGRFHSTCPVGAAESTILKLLRDNGVLLRSSLEQKFAVVREWLRTQPAPDEWTEYAIRRNGYGDLLG